jgi:hypothetical protein
MHKTPVKHPGPESYIYNYTMKHQPSPPCNSNFIFPAAWARSQPTTAPAVTSSYCFISKPAPYSNSLRLLKPMPILPTSLIAKTSLYGYYALHHDNLHKCVVCFVSMEINLTLKHVLIRRKCSQMILYLFCRPVKWHHQQMKIYR